MKSYNWEFYFIVLSGAMVFGQGVNYFLVGENYKNTDLRNFAVVLQILFGSGVMIYAFYRNKNNHLVKENNN